MMEGCQRQTYHLPTHQDALASQMGYPTGLFSDLISEPKFPVISDSRPTNWLTERNGNFGDLRRENGDDLSAQRDLPPIGRGIVGSFRKSADPPRKARTAWRRGWDSNPRYRSRYTPLAGERLQPLGHLSASRYPYLCFTRKHKSFCGKICVVFTGEFAPHLRKLSKFLLGSGFLRDAWG